MLRALTEGALDAPPSLLSLRKQGEASLSLNVLASLQALQRDSQSGRSGGDGCTTQVGGRRGPFSRLKGERGGGAYLHRQCGVRQSLSEASRVEMYGLAIGSTVDAPESGKPVCRRSTPALQTPGIFAQCPRPALAVGAIGPQAVLKLFEGLFGAAGCVKDEDLVRSQVEHEVTPTLDYPADRPAWHEVRRSPPPEVHPVLSDADEHRSKPLC